MSYDIAIIGGGIVGLATAQQLIQKNPELKIAVLEKESEPAQHQTGHNSGVIHSGIYYKPGSLKAKNCIRGYEMLLEFAKKNDIPYELCGKIIVATDESEFDQLDMIYDRGERNGLEGMRMLNSKEIREIEPYCAGIRGIWVPQTGIIDYKEVAYAYKKEIVLAGADFIPNFKVTGLHDKGDHWSVSSNKDNIMAKRIVNCAGLYSDKVAALNIEDLDTRIIPFRGEYYMIKEEARHLVNNLIYPVPDPNFPFLGVHFTRMMNGHIEAGPNAVLAFSREGYTKSDVNMSEFYESITWPGFRKVASKYWKTGMGEMYRSFSKSAFTKALQKLIPDIREHHLERAEAGVRAQACDRTGGLLDDFKIVQDNKAIHVLNAPSPAATSSLAIGDTVSDMVLAQDV